jgi:hypothetical protein
MKSIAGACHLLCRLLRSYLIVVLHSRKSRRPVTFTSTVVVVGAA